MVRMRIILLATILLGLTAFNVLAIVQKSMWVQVREGQVRSTPSFLGGMVARLSYGDRVEVYDEKNSWAGVRVNDKGLEGWIHTSALTKKRVVLKPGAPDMDQAASGDELALAGKGFNAQIEEEFKAKNRDVDYTWVDTMERITMDEAQIQKFLQEGELLPGEDLR